MRPNKKTLRWLSEQLAAMAEDGPGLPDTFSAFAAGFAYGSSGEYVAPSEAWRRWQALLAARKATMTAEEKP